MTQRARWEWNPETQDANAQLFEGSLIQRLSVLTPFPTSLNSTGIASILPLLYWVSPSLSFSTNSQTPQTPGSWGKWLLPSAGFQNLPTDPPLLQVTSSKRPELEENSGGFSWSCLWISWLKAIQRMEGPLKRGGWKGLYNILAEIINKWNVPPLTSWNEIPKEAKWSGKHPWNKMDVKCPL